MLWACDEKRGALRRKQEEHAIMMGGRNISRWLDGVRDDVKENGLSREEVCDTATWRHNNVIVHRPRVNVRIRWRGRRMIVVGEFKT